MKRRLICCWFVWFQATVNGHNKHRATRTVPPTITSFLTVPRGGDSLSQNDKNHANIGISLSRLLTTRGGDDDDYEDDEYDDEEEEDEDFDEMFGDLDDDDLATMDDEDFAEENMIDRMIVAWQKGPPLTKLYLTASFIATALGYVTNKNQFPTFLTLEWKPIVTKLQIWRPLTSFLNFGPFGLAYLMTTQFVWTYMSTLERLNHNKPYDFWIMMLFGAMSMVAGYSFLRISPKFLGHNLSTFFVYVWSRYHEGMEVNLFELFNTRAELLPWIFLAQTFLLEGEPPMLDFLGIVFGHVYHHFKVCGMLRAPKFVVDWYESDTKYSTMIRNKYKEISSDFEMQ